MVKCPVLGCSREFDTKYGLTNHLRRSEKADHQKYYKEYIEARKCLRCRRRIDPRSKSQQICWSCLQKEKPELRIAKKKLTKLCFRCGRKCEGMYSPRNTKVLCGPCKEEAKRKKKEYNRAFDEARYKKAKEDRAERRCKENVAKKTGLSSLSRMSCRKTISLFTK